MPKDNVLQIVGSPEGGMGTHIASISKALSSNYHVSLVASMDKTDKKFDEQFAKIKDNLDEVYDLTIEKKPSLKDLKNVYVLYKYFKDKKLKIIHGHGAKGGLYARALGLLLDAKVIYSPHGGSLHSMHGKVMNFVYLVIEKILFALTDRIVLDSNYEKNIYINSIHTNDKKLLVNYNGVNVNTQAQVKAYVPSMPTVIASFGILRHLKGHDLLIQAVGILVKRGFDIKLNIYGEGSERENLQQLINDLSLTGLVSLCGFVENVKPYMIDSDIIVHPSRFDALPYVPIEAMDLMRCVVVSDVGGLPEIVTDKYDGLVFRNEDVEDLVLAIEYLLNNPEEKEEFVRHAKQTVLEKFDTKLMFKRLDHVYKDLL